ncbi:MAG: response regulator [Deltaproteobacteria bacterium]|jgi:CheY-like chemotaxis protein|nr:response regulator [Deltaproteobacteria bacterium]
MTSVLKVVIFDDVVAARGEVFHIPGLSVDVYPHADDSVAVCTGDGGSPDVVFMDFEMGRGRKSGSEAIEDLRAAAFRGKIIAISSDPVANQRMRDAGANDALQKKAHLRSFLVHLASLEGGS